MAADESNTEARSGKFFPDLGVEEDGPEVTEIDSLCMNCRENGVTRLLLTKIPFFREVILSSFNCEHCNYSDTGVQPGGEIQEKGVKYTVNIINSKDLDRQVVKMDQCVFSIPAVQFEQPPTKKGEVTTVEGLLTNVIDSLQAGQEYRKTADPEAAVKIDEFIAKLTDLKDLKEPFKIMLDDPTGNSFIENPLAPSKDPEMVTTHYTRTRQQNIQIGLSVEEDEEDEGVTDDLEDASEENQDGRGYGYDEVVSFPTNCPNCNVGCSTNMKLVDIPFFKQVVIMATICESCGFKDNEVKGGSGIEEKGTSITLKITDPSDLDRDVLKSDSCGLTIPELDLELEHGTLGGRFTTVEGLLTNIRDQLASNPFMVGDSSQGDRVDKMANFCKRLDKVIKREHLGIHFVLDDPAGNSYLQNVYAPDPDPEMTVERYERSEQQNDDLGLTHMKTENYENDES